MNAAEIHAARDELGMTLASFAFWLGLEGENGRRKVRAWESGKEAITGPAKRAIRLALALKRFLETNPDDDEWLSAFNAGMEALGRGPGPAMGCAAGSR